MGGFVGQHLGGTVSKSFSSGLVTSNAGQGGGLIGQNQPPASSVLGCFWDVQTSGQSISAGGTSKTSVQMKTLATLTAAAWNFENIWSIETAVNDGYPYLKSHASFFLYIWTGNIDSDWEKAGNWSGQKSPNSTVEITIPDVHIQPVISSDVVIENINILPNSQLTIGAEGTLTVTGAITNNAGHSGLLILSDANGTGSLLHNSNAVSASVQHFFHGKTQAWHLLSSPVVSQSISPEFTPSGTYTGGNGYNFLYWSEPDTSWINFNQPSLWNQKHGDNTLQKARGYLVSFQETTTTKTFTGLLNNATVSLVLTKTTTSGDESGHNLVGNPYPSS
ncbi:MAG: hypothetical protein Q8N36_03160, partial [bacterium]|nr:hypothetical protein [bacterium]